MLPVRRLADEHVHGEGARLLLAGSALHTDVSPDAPSSGFLGWLLTSLAAFPADGTVNDDPLGHLRSRQPAREPGGVAPVDVGATDEVEGRQVVAQRGERVEEIQRALERVARRTASCRDRLARLVMGISNL
jgi:hypothetical protein